MSNFDLEQEIMSCWSVTEDIRAVAENVNNGSNHKLTLDGLAALYDCKFEKLWRVFNEMLSKQKHERNNDE